MVSIRPCTIAEIEQSPNITEMLSKYADESAIEGMPRPVAQMEMYKAMESSGGLYPIGAFSGDLLIGFITIISTVLPHYGARISITESYFVPEEYRNIGAGLKLLSAAEQYARDTDSAGLLISAPNNGALSKVLPKRGYRNTNSIFFKGFSNV